MEINETKLKEILHGEREEYQWYVRVAFAGLQSQIELVFETIQDMQEQITAIRDIIIGKNIVDAREKLQIV